MGKLAAIWNLFKVGQSVENPVAWKTGAITVSVLTPVIASLNNVLKAFGLDLGITDSESMGIAAGIVAVTNIVVHLISSKSIGVVPSDK